MMTAEQIFETTEPTNIVIFGATGDLTKRKLLPALVRMFICVVHNSTEEQWVELVRESLHQFSDEVSNSSLMSDIGVLYI